MRRDADQKIFAEGAAHGPRVERVDGQLHAVATRGARDVRAVVDDYAGRAPACNLGGARAEFVERARAQVLLAELDERDARVDGASDERDERVELGDRDRSLAGGLAACD